MLELYKKRLQASGSYMGEALKNQSDMIMNETFKRDAKNGALDSIEEAKNDVDSFITSIIREQPQIWHTLRIMGRKHPEKILMQKGLFQ